MSPWMRPAFRSMQEKGQCLGLDSNLAMNRHHISFFLSFIFFLLQCVACRILVPWPGIEPRPSAVEVQVLTTEPPGKSQWDSGPIVPSGNWLNNASFKVALSSLLPSQFPYLVSLLLSNQLLSLESSSHQLLWEPQVKLLGKEKMNRFFHYKTFQSL